MLHINRLIRPLALQAVPARLAPRMGMAGWKLLVAVLLILVSGFVLSANGPGSRAAFTEASLVGNYALVGIGGANRAASVGITSFDGAGTASRRLVLNEVDPGGDGRILLNIPATGTYTVNPDGTGTAEFLNELPDGQIVPFTFDFVITEARQRGRSVPHIALAIHMVQREPGIAASLVLFDLTRLPD